ncbi:hypothetical protein GQ43DRAFT_233231 [Delitschia confertaspora ATCC 74209]|uniref:Uncharacterized protein n=1 Tax=Delitschia confertaspora ATCC 74209 TaxID=1513339 RepID=A0A9P4JHQ5_9PLEO|nr:hypothetical protein GQ43DRAFT_233231 [Delitschia confertaspora ATCC 74209]
MRCLPVISSPRRCWYLRSESWSSISMQSFPKEKSTSPLASVPTVWSSRHLVYRGLVLMITAYIVSGVNIRTAPYAFKAARLSVSSNR